MNRADLLYTVLQDGRLHSRHEIFRVCGEFFLTNNAASELRAKRGVVVVHTVKDGEHFYQLVALAVLDAVEDTTRRGDPPSSLPGRADGMDSAASNTTRQLDLFEGVAA